MQITVFCNAELKRFFFSADHCQRLKSDIRFPGVSEHWIPITLHLPMHVTPRPGLDDGKVTNLEEYILVFHQDETEIANPDPTYVPNYRFGVQLPKE